MNKLNQKGAIPLALILLVVVVVAVGFAGWKVWSVRNSTNPTNTGSSAETDTAIKNKSDLKQAETTLNNTDLDKDLDTSELDSALQ